MQAAQETSVSAFEYASFDALLRAYVSRRQKSKPQFSLRGMAKQLRMKSPSLLAMIARGERLPRPDLARRIMRHMSLKPREMDYVTTLVAFRRARETEEKLLLAERLSALKPANADVTVEIDALQLIARWHHIAICEMTRLKDFSPNPDFISSRLGRLVTPEMAAESLALLQRLGILVLTDDGMLVKSADVFRSPPGVPSTAVRAFHKQMLLRAGDAIDRQTPAERLVSGVTLAVCEADLPAARQMIVDFREEFTNRFGKPRADQVFHFAAQFFRVT